MTHFVLVLNIRYPSQSYHLPAQQARDLYIAGELGMHRKEDEPVWNYCVL